MKKVKLFSIIVIIVEILIIGCIPAPIRNISEVGYIKEGFSESSLESEGLALLPIVAGQGQEAYRRPLAEAINQSIQKAKPELKFLNWEETMSILNKEKLVEKYQKAISSYRETAIIDHDLLQEIGEALGTRYLLFISLEEFHKSSKSQYYIGAGWHTSKTAKVDAFAQIWDCSTGDVVWEGRGAAESEGTELTYDEGYEKYCNIAAEGLICKLFNIKPIKEKASEEESQKSLMNE